MKAVVYHEHGSPDVLHCEDITKPTHHSITGADAGYLQLPDGKAVNGFSIITSGTTTLFAALKITTGLVNRRAAVAASSWTSGTRYRQIHVALDNFHMRKPKEEGSLKRHGAKPGG